MGAHDAENGRHGRSKTEHGAATLARIAKRVSVDTNGCWLWQGAKTSRGYGAIAFMVEGRRRSLSRSVHRVVAEVVYGPLPADALICHVCDIKACCNPEHLYVGDRLTNARDARERGLLVNVLAQANAAKTHCPVGHAYDDANTYINPRTGCRKCRTCQRTSAAVARQQARLAA